jgi:hypothetical protein
VKVNGLESALVPTAFVAVTRQAYFTPTVSPVTVIGVVALDVVVRVGPAVNGMHVAVKLVIALPPLEPAANVITTWPAVCVIVVIVGAFGTSGTVPATNELEAADAALFPITFVAITVQVYVLPVVSDATVIGDEAPETDWVTPPSLDVHVAVKPVMALPPVAFAVNATIPELVPRVTPVMLGAEGVVAATNDAEAAEEAPSPIALVARTVQV